MVLILHILNRMQKNLNESTQSVREGHETVASQLVIVVRTQLYDLSKVHRISPEAKTYCLDGKIFFLQAIEQEYY